MSCGPATQISLFAQPPEHIPDTVVTAAIHDTVNSRNGHLLIASGVGDWLFLNLGSAVRFGLVGSGALVELDPDQLRQLGNYCLNIADRIGGAQ